MSYRFRAASLLSVCLLLILSHTSLTAFGQGIMMQGVGPVNRAMGGASTAAPIDASGAIYWNPASISGLASSEVTFGAELLLQTEEISSTVAGPFSGTTNGEPGASLIPQVSIVHRDPNSPWTYGLGMLGVAGFKSNYPSSATNPVLMPQPMGLGRVYAELEVFQIIPTIAYEVTEKFSIGIGPTLAIGKLNMDPFVFASPDDANGDTFPTYPHAMGTRYQFGGGVQIGAFYMADNGWNYGASVKSPTWMENFRYFTEDEVGAPRLEKFDADLPMIVSVGLAYTGFEDVVWALDVRYFDYANTNGFRDANYDNTGALTGLGWKSIVSVSTGLQWHATDRLVLRTGYTYQQNPISDTNTFFNAASPLVIGHIASVGCSFVLAEHVAFNLAYLHGFEGEKTGPIILPGVGAVAGSSVTSRVSADALGAGITVKY